MSEVVKEKFISCPGDQFRPVYTPEIGKDGEITLVQTGVEDMQQFIDSFKDSCDISVMVQRYLAGDETALMRGNPVFMDLLGAPKNLAEAYALNFRAEAAFENLPSNIKEQFGNSFYRFLEDAGSEKWFSILKAEPVKPEPIKEVTEVEK